MRRSPTQEDVERWQAFADKVKAAGELLRDADVLLGQLIPTLDNEDETSFALVAKMGMKLENARMAVGSVEHPVSQHWAGGPKDAPWPNTLSWRY